MSRSFFEPLETRQMLSATLKNGVLTVEGTELADVIAISQDKTNVRVNENGKATAFKASSVKSVVVNGRGGDDQLLGRTNLQKPMTLRGGAGNDILVGGAKGDVFEVARLAGIMATKRTSELIPLCHPLGLDSAAVDFEVVNETTVRIEARATVRARTGVEMEALTAVSVAALTIYDMVKSVDRSMEIGPIRLLEKSGGKSGHYSRGE